jgi:hypothetical protein|tara:strand:+ start:1482 stop:1952 length:471 start_codon:yes stop_codon:yes gene_type:complete
MEPNTEEFIIGEDGVVDFDAAFAEHAEATGEDVGERYKVGGVSYVAPVAISSNIILMQMRAEATGKDEAPAISTEETMQMFYDVLGEDNVNDMFDRNVDFRIVAAAMRGMFARKILPKAPPTKRPQDRKKKSSGSPKAASRSKDATGSQPKPNDGP